MTGPRPLIMGIVNVTPNSFSDGGKYYDPQAAIEHARELVGAGADIIDIGGESTRPGATRVTAEQEWHRIGQVVQACVAAGFEVSVDTVNSETARRAIASGVRYINDVSGGLADPKMHRTLAEYPTVRYLLGHWRGNPETMSELATYGDVIDEVAQELATQFDAASAAGMADDQLICDPGIGFAKTAEHNWRILARLNRFSALGFPLMIGVSRKRFLTGLTETAEVGAVQRDLATAVISALLANQGLWAVRVHNVAATRVALDIAEYLWRARRA